MFLGFLSAWHSGPHLPSCFPNRGKRCVLGYSQQFEVLLQLAGFLLCAATSAILFFVLPLSRATPSYGAHLVTQKILGHARLHGNRALEGFCLVDFRHQPGLSFVHVLTIDAFLSRPSLFCSGSVLLKKSSISPLSRCSSLCSW